MKICIVIPSEQQKEQAGVRIRYGRIQKLFLEQNNVLEIIPIQNVTSDTIAQFDVLLISKCYDARAVILAYQAYALGKQVGVDLFDDYFSQVEDSRFVRLRFWLRSISKHLNFILCSTDKMKVIAQHYAPHLPVHIMNDPAEEIDEHKIVRSIENKLQIVKANQTIDIAWFGMGDNPYFPVGLSDLSAFSHELFYNGEDAYMMKLHILTNRRALTPKTLGELSRLNLSYEIDEWSESKEKELLQKCIIAFLPVNGQNFSIVKSLNRAVTALVQGSQVLSCGFPLYDPFKSFIYRSMEEFMNDLKVGQLRFSEATVPAWQPILEEWTNVKTEYEKLVLFLNGLQSTHAKPMNLSAVIHGCETLGDVHKYASKMGILSVASPLATAQLNYDIRFIIDEGNLGFLISKKKAHLLPENVQTKLRNHGTILATEYKKLDLSDSDFDFSFTGIGLLKLQQGIGMTAVYPVVSEYIQRVLEKLFPDIEIFFSEQSKNIPWHIEPKENLDKHKGQGDR